MTSRNKKPLNLLIAAALGLSTVATTAVAANNITKPSINAQADANIINFSFAIAQQQHLDMTEQAAVSSSDEYYYTVTGEQLNKGVAVHTTSKGALIKVSRQAGQGQPFEAAAFELFAANQPNEAIAVKKIGEKDLSATGIFAHSAAVKMNEKTAAGEFTLRYQQPLLADGKFIVHVKEQGSANQLKITTAKQNYLQTEAVKFDTMMLAKQDTIMMDSVEAYIVSPAGKKYAAKVVRGANGVTEVSATNAVMATDAIESPINGLYELRVNAMADNNGQLIRRSGKIAFGLAPVTGNLSERPLLTVKGDQAQAHIGLTVKQAGRFEARALLMGHDEAGNLKPIMETHSAQNFAAGEQVIKMQFDQKILAKSGLKAPYKIQNVRLYDQTRMSRL